MIGNYITFQKLHNTKSYQLFIDIENLLDKTRMYVYRNNRLPKYFNNKMAKIGINLIKEQNKKNKMGENELKYFYQASRFYDITTKEFLKYII